MFIMPNSFLLSELRSDITDRIKHKTLYMHTLDDVANWFLANMKEVSNKKLQKLMYYAYSWFLTFNNESAKEIRLKFFDARFEAWVHGAVCPELYNKYKEYGSSDLPQYTGKIANFSKVELEILNQVCNIYGKYSGDELEFVCQQEDPWKNARKNLNAYEPSSNRIKDSDIFKYYLSRSR